MKRNVAAALMIAWLLVPGAASAQGDPGAGPTNIQPAGIAVQDWEAGVIAVKGVPSPIGPALPGSVFVQTNSLGVSAILYLDGQYRQYRYDCATGVCVGFAPDLWHALPRDAQRSYVDGLLDALVGAYPDRQIYHIVLDGIGWAAHDPVTGERAYDFKPPL